MERLSVFIIFTSQWRGAKCDGDSLAVTLEYLLPSFEDILRLPGVSYSYQHGVLL